MYMLSNMKTFLWK